MAWRQWRGDIEIANGEMAWSESEISGGNNQPKWRKAWRKRRREEIGEMAIIVKKKEMQ
jgi:hypothetical protein